MRVGGSGRDSWRWHWLLGPTGIHSRFKQEGGKVRLYLKDHSSCCMHHSLGWRPREKAVDQKCNWSCHPGKSGWVAACTGVGQWSWENQTGLHSLLEVALPGHECEFQWREKVVKDES